MKVFQVDLTLVYNGHCTVEAENEEQALQIAQDSLNYKTLKEFPDEVYMCENDGIFSFGEATADYCYEVGEC